MIRAASEVEPGEDEDGRRAEALPARFPHATTFVLQFLELLAS